VGTGATTATLSWTPTVNGNYSVSATYDGTLDPNYGSAASLAFTQAVGGAGTATTISASPASPSVWGQPVTLTATVTVNTPATGSPTGSVQFIDGAATVIGSQALPASAPFTVSITTAALSVGNHSITAKYLGDTQFASSTSSTPVVYTVDKAGTGVTTVINTLGSGVFGTAMTFATTLSISSPGAGTPVGTITFKDGANSIGTANVNAGASTYYVTTSSLSVGNHTIFATYNGDGDFLTSSTGIGLSVTITKATLAVSITSPTVNALPIGGSIYYGQPITFVATLTGVNSTPASGTVNIVDNAAPADTICSAVVTAGAGATATATCSTTATTANYLGWGNHTLTISGLGTDPNYNLPAVGTNTYSFAVAKAATTTTLTANPAAAAPGTSVTFTATVAVVSPGAAPLLGRLVTFQNNGATMGCDSVAIGAASTATCTVVFPQAGVFNISALYNGDVNTAQSTTLLPYTVNKPAPVLTLVASANPSVYGQSVTFTATAAAPVAGGPVPTGAMQFYDGATIIGVKTLVVGATSSSASLTFPADTGTLLAGGTHAISVMYVPGSDPNYGQVMSSTIPLIVTQVVSKANSKVSAITVTANPATVVYGEPVTFTVTVSPFDAGNTGKPGGTVIFKDAGNQIGPVATVDPTTGIATITVTTLAVSLGHSNIVAYYQGDTNYNASNSAAAPSLPIVAAPTEVFLGALPAAPTYGQAVTLTARVCALNFGVTATNNISNDCRTIGAGLALPSGTITFYDGSTALVPAVPVDSTGTASLNVTLVSSPLGVVATHVITAQYNVGGADTNYAVSPLSASSNLVEGLAPTQTTVTTNISAPVTGQVFVLTANVSSAGSFGPPPAGTVQFVDSSGSGFVIGTGTLVANGSYSYAQLTVPSAGVNALAVGTHVITANYLGSSTYAISNSPTSGATALVLMVSKASTATALSLCSIQVTGACTTDTPQIGQTVKLTATVTVTAPGAGAPTGTVQFFNGTALLGTAAVTGVSGGGGSTVYQASLQITLPLGSLSLTAVYSGDGGFATSTSAVVTQSVTKPNVSINITSSLNPAILGTPVTYTVIVAPVPPATGVPTGAVTFYDGITQISSPIALVGGAATYTPATSAMFVGLHPIGVTYNGDANFQGLNSGPVVYETINKVPASLYLTSNSYTAVASQVITLTVQVAGPASLGSYPTATGQVVFYDGNTQIGVGTLAGGFATLNINNLAAGLHNLSAMYGGDSNWTNATSVFVAQTISKATTVTQISSSVNPAVTGQQVVFTVTVSVPAPGTLPATGQVQLYDNNNALGSPQLANNGTFTVPVQSFAPGTHNIYALYLGDANFASSQSATLSEVVNKAPTTTTVAAMPYSSTSGQSVTLTAVVNVTPPGTGVPTGTVQFVNVTTATILGTAPLTVLGGVYTASIATNALNQAGAPQLLTATYSGDANFATSTSPAVAQSVFGNQLSVTNAAGYNTSHFAPDSIANLWGDHLATTTLSATQIPLPTALAGTTVTVVDSAGVNRLAPLFYVSPGQINFVVPDGTAFGLATITVTTSGGVSASTGVLITYTAPGIFSANGTGQGVAAAQLVTTHSDGSQSLLPSVATYNAAQSAWVGLPVSLGTATDTATLVLYGTGVRYRPSPTSVTASINGLTLPVQYSGAQPTFVGLDQMNINLPRTLVGAGTVNVYVTVNGELSNTVTLTIQ
jgi:uncharacterized protein (TIGR03437 family)